MDFSRASCSIVSGVCDTLFTVARNRKPAGQRVIPSSAQLHTFPTQHHSYNSFQAATLSSSIFHIFFSPPTNNNILTSDKHTHSTIMFPAFLLQLFLAALAWAAPIADEVTTTGMNPAQRYGTGGGIIGFIVLVLDIIVWSKSCTSLILHLPCTILTHARRSRGPEIEPSTAPKAPLVLARLHLSHRWHHHLLALLEPQGTQHVRADCIGEAKRRSCSAGGR